MLTITMALTRKAKNKGGDRYEATLSSGERLVIYFPQDISRNGGIARESLTITVE